MRNALRSILLAALTAVALVGCNDDEYLGNWLKVSTLNAKGCGGSSVFSIGNKAYLVAGYGYYYTVKYFNSTWVFDTEDYSWTESDTLPGAPRKDGVAFTIGGKGYYCGGIGADGSYFGNMYEFDPEAEKGSKWRELENDPYPDGAFFGGVGFAIGDCGYVGGGMNDKTGPTNKYFRFDPSKPEGSRWTQIDKEGLAVKRLGGNSFVIGDKAYILGGRHNDYRVKHFECYNASTDEWTVISEDMLEDYNIDMLFRYNASTFAIGNKGYITCGVKFTGEVLRDTWEFTPDANNGKGAWQMIAKFDGASRYCAPTATINGSGYLFCGQNGVGSTNFKDDVWKFNPDEEYNRRTYR